MVIRLVFLVSLSLIVQTGVCVSMPSIELSNQLPCDFINSINITDGIYYSNKSIMYNGVVFPKDLYAKVNYITSILSSHITVDPHIRGCLCNLKPCLRFCCPEGSNLKVEGEGGTCSKSKNLTIKIEGINVINEKNEKRTVPLNDHFGLVYDFPCKKIYLPGEQFHITHKGQVILPDESSFTHHDYCMITVVDLTTHTIGLNLAVCFEGEESNSTIVESGTNIEQFFLPICMMLSVLFIIATLIVYGCIPEIRQLNEKYLMCYLIVLASAYTLLSISQFNYPNDIHPKMCLFVGYTLHFSFLSAFAWLNAINFDLWLSFQSSSKFKQLSEQFQFFWYIAYGYGIPGFLTIGIFILDQIESIPEHLKPGMGVIGCFNLNGLTQELLFFYLPASVFLISNLVLFISTAKRIHQVQLEANKNQDVTLQETNSGFQKVLNKKKDIFMLYLRLFAVAGVSWITEIIWFVVPFNETIYLLSDSFNSLQGVIIFFLFVMKRRVLRLIKKKWNTWRGSLDPNESEAPTNQEGEDYLRMDS